MIQNAPAAPELPSAQLLAYLPDAQQAAQAHGDDSVALGMMRLALRRRGVELSRDNARELMELARDPAVPRVREPASAPSPDGRHLPAPLSFGELLAVPDPEERDLANGLIPADANILFAAYPKSHKTNVVLELAVSLVTATLFLGRFTVPRTHRVGLVLMEDAKHRIRRRLERMCKAHGVNPADIADVLHLWFRPPLRFADARAVADLSAYAADLDLDMLAVDNWSYVAAGDSNDADVVTQQLAAFSSIREARCGLSVLLVQHARKQAQDRNAERLTDVIRNSSAFGAWYDCGVVLSRQDEHAPVTVRAELRDQPAPAPFSFTVEDEYPGTADRMPSGYLRLIASDRTATDISRDADAERYRGEVAAFLAANPGASKAALKKSVRGDNLLVEAAFGLLCGDGIARYEEPAKRGTAGRCYLNMTTSLDLAVTSLGSDVGRDLADLAAPPLKGARSSEAPAAKPTVTPTATFPCVGCGQHRFPTPDVQCFKCRST
jgi:hypothetical protein